MKLRKIYPANLKVGMVVVGQYAPEAPTNHVQEMAHGLVVADVLEQRDPKTNRVTAVIPVWIGGMPGFRVDVASGVKYLVIED